jgi:predicted nucleotidyltransferase
MIKEEISTSIKSTIQSFLPDCRVLLFGSRATEKDNLNSDYDLLIITKQTYSSKEKVSWNTKIHKALVVSIDAPCDLIMHSEEEVDTYRNYFGHIVRYALKEGIPL